MRREYRVAGGDITISDYLRSKGYQTCEYIESHGAEYIDTGIIFSVNDEVTFDFSMEFRHPSYFSGGYDDGMHAIYLGYYNNAYGNKIAFIKITEGSSWSGVGDGEISSNERAKYKIIFHQNEIIGYKNDIHIETVPINYNFINHTAYIFCSDDQDDGAYAKTYAKCYKYEIKNKRNFIPVYNISTGSGAMWDSIEDKFYFNLGSGSFTHGDNIEITESINQ